LIQERYRDRNEKQEWTRTIIKNLKHQPEPEISKAKSTQQQLQFFLYEWVDESAFGGHLPHE
jgi:hypothetical protein